MLIASAAAGLLWNRFGAAFAFYTGAAFAALAMVGLALNTWRQRRLGGEPCG
ncbi:hypothetical protein [Desulfobacter curvatus]|uniref:hypothetical protein n=1 Tax=Desulfobacter curvatus TaxID=2290 RepID=UPI00035D36CD|nr:hypothetical protein [Desulfobacter curvatus]